MFGVSFTELILIGAVALIVVGPSRLPGMLGTLGKWSNKLRRMLFEVRSQSGIDEILRSEGISGGLKEIRALRSAVRGDIGALARGTSSLVAGKAASTSKAAAVGVGADPQTPPPLVQDDPYAAVKYDRSREYPDEGCDAYGAIPDDLWTAANPEPSTSPSATSLPTTAGEPNTTGFDKPNDSESTPAHDSAASSRGDTPAAELETDASTAGASVGVTPAGPKASDALAQGSVPQVESASTPSEAPGAQPAAVPDATVSKPSTP